MTPPIPCGCRLPRPARALGAPGAAAAETAGTAFPLGACTYGSGRRPPLRPVRRPPLDPDLPRPGPLPARGRPPRGAVPGSRAADHRGAPGRHLRAPSSRPQKRNHR
ncbi:hypothetical protein RVR_10501 [Actinacidiphila reveromycinica]|uniref:Uncharacterized protein n=1 Tax=Actinacidiphila reveromycinica TaxID=659352 RepID=A0A7U3UMV0_9ACTN|nr:hypothetical protein RVR_10501 [Streptomyces sp. SN-593]